MTTDSEHPGIIVAVSNRQSLHTVDTAWFRSIARRILANLDIQQADLSIQFVDNPTIARLNWDHLQHEGPTDIITFPISEPDDPVLEGELVISVPWAQAVAEKNGDSLQDELNLYVVHGILHLTGQDDIEPEDAAQMRRQELRVLQALALAVPKDRFDDAGNDG